MKKLYMFSLLVIFSVLLGYSNLNSSQASTIPWDGTYIREHKFARSILEITSTTKNSFNFKIHAFSGGNTGGVSGTAIVTDNLAVFKDNKNFTINFSYNDGNVTINHTLGANPYAGMGVGFEGVYARKGTEKLADWGQNYFTHFKVFKEGQEQEFVKVVDKNYEKFTNTGHMFYDEKDLDHFNARVHRMGVRGLFTILESIIMVRDSDNTFWAAVIDNDKVLYFTNSHDKKIPQTILHWQERFKEKPICLQ